MLCVSIETAPNYVHQHEKEAQVDGGTPELFEEMRTNAVWDKFYQNIQAFHKLNKRTKMYAITCIPHDKPLNIHWMHPQFKALYQLLDWYELRRLHNWAGEVSGLNFR